MLTIKEIEEQLVWYTTHLQVLKEEFEKVNMSDCERETLSTEEFLKRIKKLMAIADELAECDTCIKHLEENLLSIRIEHLLTSGKP